MSKQIPKRSQKAGLPPGTPMYIGDTPTETARITIIHYSETELEERQVEHLEECFAFKDKQTVNWINGDGLHAGGIAQLGHCFGVPALVLEDILNTHQRPKLEDFDGSLYPAGIAADAARRHGHGGLFQKKEVAIRNCEW
ncbi:MAG: hypothetical protein L6R45_25450 [Anaerolineae bacterium]|nr:hypothetical protein [Anaerolineae bacterium]